MAKMEWTKVPADLELVPGVPVKVEVRGEEVMLIRIGEHVHAWGHKCTHYGGPLSEGVVSGHSVICPWHTARFDLATGAMESAPALDDLPRYAVKLEEGQLYVGPKQRATFPAVGGKDDRTFVIVGAGAAGNAAAETLRREAFAGRIVTITPESDGPYDRPNLSKDYLSGEAKPEWIPLRSPEFYKKQGIEIVTGRRVTAVDPDTRTVSFGDGERMKFDRLLLATGGVPRKLDVPGSDLENFFLLRSLADARRIVAAVQQARTAVIIGSGFIGMEAASSLRHRGLTVHVASQDDVPFVRVFGERVGRFFCDLAERNGVVFHPGCTPTEVQGDGKVRGVVLSDGSRLQADLVIAGVGIDPAVDCVRAAGLVQDGAVPVNAQLRTRAESIYAAGDIALVPDPHTGQPRRIEHWTVAERQGQHAARAMLGSTVPYDEVPFFWTMQFGVALQYVGYVRKPDRIVLRGSPDRGKFLAGYYENGTLRAAAGVGMDKEVILLSRMLRDGRSLSPAHLENTQTDLAELMRHEQAAKG